MKSFKYIKWFNEVGKDDVNIVGGKGANLGELTQMGLDVPPGFCITAKGYDDFIERADLDDIIKEIMEGLDVEDTDALTLAGEKVREVINNAEVFSELEEEIKEAYREFSQDIGITDPEVAVRSSATAEDLPDASFAGEQETYLHIRGEEELLKHTKKCWASLWTARAIFYRETQNYDHFQVSLCIVIQKMVNSEKSGVMFTANPVDSDTTEMMINASWGLGEAVVSGAVTPDEYIIDKATRTVKEKNIAKKKKIVIKNEDGVGTREVDIETYLGEEFVDGECLTEEDLNTLVHGGLTIENLYGSHQDIEWGIDRDTKHLYILQARPITTLEDTGVAKEDRTEKDTEEELVVLLKGLGASQGIGRGKVRKIKDISEMSLIKEGEILVTDMTNPDMVPAMKKSAGVVTNEGGRTCHAAIVSRELQIPCIVGTSNATEILEDGMEVTVDATRGVVYEGYVLKEKETKEAENTGVGFSLNDAFRKAIAPITATKVYMNLGEPDLIDRYKDLPFDGIGLMRTELIFLNKVGAHPMYLVRTGQGQHLIDQLSEGIMQVATAVYPRNIVVRMSDFRSNEYRGLKGGDEVEPIEQNPMIGWRGVSRYISPMYEEGFRLECRALRKVREENGMTNVIPMLPFVRMPEELVRVKEIMAEEGLKQSRDCKIWIMAEVPSVVMQIDEFAELVDGFSIGSNDLTQLIMGADRDSGILNNMGYFDERNEAVKRAIKTIIDGAHRHGKTVSICGQAPSQYTEFAEFLVNCGVDSMSVNPDTVDYTRRIVAAAEQKIILNKMRGL